MRDYGKALSFAPRLPSQLTGLSFGLIYRGRPLRVNIHSRDAQYELLDGEPLEILHHGENVKVTVGSPQTRPLPPGPQRPPPQPPPGRSPSRGQG